MVNVTNNVVNTSHLPNNCVVYLYFTMLHALIAFECHCFAFYVFMQRKFFIVHGLFTAANPLVAAKCFPFHWKSLILMNIVFFRSSQPKWQSSRSMLSQQNSRLHLSSWYIRIVMILKYRIVLRIKYLLSEVTSKISIWYRYLCF